MTRSVLGMGTLLVVAACAQSTQPPGGPVPESPPQVVATTPDTFEIREGFTGPVRIEFERRISERPEGGTLRDAVIVSPRTGEVEVSHDGRGVEISMEGGFQPGTVYQVTLSPRLQDLFQNTMERPFELFFSTGPGFEPTVLGGVILDRLTLAEVGEVRLDAELRPDGPTFTTRSDSTGLFAFQYLPAGRYRVSAYEDQNGNFEPDFIERQDAVEVELGTADTLVLTDLALLEPDTTAAVLMSAAAPDSMTVELTFDDPIDPEAPLEGVSAQLEREDGTAPTVREVLHPHEWEALQEARAREEAGPEDPDDPETEQEEEEVPEPEAQEPVLPGDRLVLVLESPLEPGAIYTVRVEGLINLTGIPDGGGNADFEAPEPPPEEDPPDDADGDPDGDDGGGASGLTLPVVPGYFSPEAP